MQKYTVKIKQPKPRSQFYIDTKSKKRLIFDFGEVHFEQRARFKQIAEKLKSNDLLTIIAPKQLETEHFIILDALHMTIKNHKNERLYTA